MTGREAALKVLHEVLYDGAFSNDALRDCFRGHGEIDSRDRRFTEHLVRSSLKNLLPIEDVLNTCSTVKVKKMKPEIRCILTAGACELLYMNTPDHAAVSEYVELTKKAGFRGLSGFVNAVLRRSAREGREIVGKETGALKAGLPEELYQDIISWYGEEEALKIFSWYQKEDTEGLWIRRNVSSISHDGLVLCLQAENRELVPSGITDDTYLLKNAGDLTESAAFLNGLFTVQDLSSALSGEIVRDLFASKRETFRVIDSCASPGGKTLHAADLMESGMPKTKKELVSCDVSERKAERIRENVNRCGFSFVTTEVRDASLITEEFTDRFDLVILDVPCSGLGVIGKRPEIRFRAGREARESLTELQKRILDVNSRYVRPGGTLVYSTCTIAPEENIGQVRAFIGSRPEFKLRGFAENLSDKIPGADSASEGYLQILPGSIGSDGFFMARMERTE